MDSRKRTHCSFQELFGREVKVAFNQERATSDGGAVLLAAADRKLGIVEKLAGALAPHRQIGKTVHATEVLLRQRIFGIVCGYPDANDAARIGRDPLMQILAGGDRPIRELASQPTISRFENSVTSRDLHRICGALAEVVIENERRLRKGRATRIVIDMDPTVDPTHGDQQLTFFNGFYDTHCYLPMLAFIQFDGEPEQHLIGAILRPGNAPDKHGARAILKRLIPMLQLAFPRAEICVRLDGGFANEEVLGTLESFQGVKYAVNMGKNPRLLKGARPFMRRVRRKFRKTKRAARIHGEFRYAARKWQRKRRVLVKAEIVIHPGREPRENPRFLITNMRGSPRRIYEEFYCLRGDAENRIKELKSTLGLDRTSCSNFRANQLRVIMSAAAFVLLQEIRRCARCTAYERAQAPRLVDHLIKLGARVTVSVRRILIEMPRTAPARSDWLLIARNLGALAT